jgi:hypothetical protein
MKEIEARSTVQSAAETDGANKIQEVAVPAPRQADHPHADRRGTEGRGWRRYSWEIRMKPLSILIAATAPLVLSSVCTAVDLQATTTLANSLVQSSSNATSVTQAASSQITSGRIFPFPINIDAYQVQVLPLDTAGGMGDGIIAGTVQGAAVVLVNGEVIPLPGKAGYTNITPTAVSSNGYIVGTANCCLGEASTQPTAESIALVATTVTGQPVAQGGAYVRGLFWSTYNKEPIDIGSFGDVTMPTSVNSSGVVVGASYAVSQWVSFPVAFAWSPSEAIHSIAPPYSSGSFVWSISDTGYAAGYTLYPDEEEVTRWYPPNLAWGNVTTGDFALGALDDGTVYGYTDSWNLSDQATFIEPNAVSIVLGMSNPRRKVGTNAFQSPQNAWTVPPGGSTEQLLPMPTGATGGWATQVDDCGTILGTVTYPNISGNQPVLWKKLTCDSSGLLAP